MLADATDSLAWRKSSFSGEEECVELVNGRLDVRVRHSLNPGGGVLLFGSPEWWAFLTRVKTR
jgi:hypothetical protein